MNQARSRAIDRVRYEQRRKRVDPGTSLAADSASAASSEPDVTARDASRILEAALRMLTPEERQSIETAFFGELTHAQTAQRLNQPVGTIKSRSRSGLEKLRRALQVGMKAS